MKKAILVDVDGTLANNNHRQHFVQPPEGEKKDWKNFNKTILQDTPYEDIVWLVKTLHNAGCAIVIVTAREGTERIRRETKHWLDVVAGLEGVYEKIYHRDAQDFRDDSIIKLELLADVRRDGYEPFMVLDDRNRVVDAWREAGVRCLQVQPGDF